MSPSSPVTEPLPHSVQVIADVIGRDAALLLASQLPRAYATGRPSGRAMLYVPKQVTPGHRLVQILGAEAAAKLIRVFAGEVMLLATCAGVKRSERNGKIAQLLAEGAAPEQVREMFGLSPSRFRAIRSLVSAVGADGLSGKNPPEFKAGGA